MPSQPPSTSQIPAHHSHSYSSSIPSTFACADNANFTCLLTPPVLNSPRKSALLLPMKQLRLRGEMTARPLVGTVGIQIQEGPAPEGLVQPPAWTFHS